MSFHDQLHRYLEQAEQEMQENERKLGEFRKIEPQLAELVGEGFGAEGKVRVTWTQRGIQDLEFDPRALRLTSGILSREVKAAIAEAVEHLRDQTMEIVNNLGVKTPEMPDPEEAQRQLGRFREEMMGAFRLSGEELDRVARLRQQYNPSKRGDRPGSAG
ncbi:MULTISPECIES: YbaB/EbfC family nucleoid-associated protein [unclassified Nocardioides]|uniref:YbaB/EbfC family nucleoid-associated protein n=1 Tax=unclassified Nocardioides TaxID=2615069 RepID=UPI0006F91B22|nr:MULTISPECIES: YbaB/EbfC family nucleoid-associated protein [unclassified Nocardioides]KQY57191.1 hypothetical protein ASD30_13185 [Nocardioides sp. Root140]KQZ68705.1 hypothetical protein ASD66_15630 [Nocardioides sp. Root151]KRF11834.1 hypothetical protein ASH02_17855 [Nocardioides sp. Soil796]